MVEIGQVEKEGAREQLQAAAGIGGVVVQEPPAHRIGDPRSAALRPAVLPPLAMPGDHQRGGVGGLVRQMPQARNIGGVVLPVAVEGGDPGGAGRLDAAANCRTLAAVVPVPHEPQLRYRGRQPQDFGHRRVLAAVVDVDDLVVEQPIERRSNLADQRCDIIVLVPDRDDDGEVHAVDVGRRCHAIRSARRRRTVFRDRRRM